ncbi:MAG: Asp-tRNA(Asn)/Glu-tRNA(Gln) amidotransferase subunit GatC [Candidatus Doudnabacteria bacterium]|nr:Asp-tRNA(Asn)/Glu-tRNA(Gln) amidotransferase subunit GatC [Candidatus Doudnabacteria bacterium]
MSISKEEVERIAKLARLEFSDAEKEKLQKELSSILGYVDKLKEVQEEVKIRHFEDEEALNLMREDVAEPNANPEEFIAQAPEREGNYVKVRSVLE